MVDMIHDWKVLGCFVLRVEDLKFAKSPFRGKERSKLDKEVSSLVGLLGLSPLEQKSLLSLGWVGSLFLV